MVEVFTDDTRYAVALAIVLFYNDKKLDTSLGLQIVHGICNVQPRRTFKVRVVNL